jgi:large subunit ribosomal protein L10
VNRAEKTAAVERMSQEFQGVPHVFVTDFRGLTVNQSSDLRRKIRAAGGRYRVVKNRLAKRAAVGTAVEKISTSLSGPCALALHRSDPVSLAKVLTEFAKDNPQLQVLAGVVDAREVLDAIGVKALATLPGLAELRAQLLALINTPATTLLRLVNTPASQTVRALDARREQMGGGGSPAAAE